MVSLLVGSTNRGVVARAVLAVVLVGALAVTFPSHTLALPLAFIEVGVAVHAALRLVNLWAVIAVGEVEVAKPVMELPNALALQEALVVVGDSVRAANGHVGQRLWTTAVGQQTFRLRGRQAEVILS